ncbi:MAG: DNA polymerase III subunit alpha [Deltaproteobacteria bacterium]|nr:DNA polymerase III subunit alpha [Deltaproteobacteria bacterium]
MKNFECAPFVHLHVHSAYSLLEGADTEEALVRAAARRGMSALALTDTNALHGAVSFYRAARAAKVKPILGAEITEGGGPPHPPRQVRSLAVLLARDMEGYTNLCRVITARQLENDFSLPEALGQHGGGLFVLSGRREAAESLLPVVPDGSLFVELVHRGGGEGAREVRLLAEWAKSRGLPVVAANDVHFADPPGHRTHRILTAVRTLRTVGTLPPEWTAHPGAWLQPPARMAHLFRGLPEALENAVRIAEACNVELEMGRVRFPCFGLPEGETPFSVLWKAASEGLQRLYRPLTRSVVDRLQHELRVIDLLGFAAYFLVVWDIARYAAREGIPMVGRGSAANSLVCYALGITSVDPMRYGLYFERFLNPERTDCPDIDLDFPWNRREQILQYVYQRYGNENVAMIATFVRFRGRSIVREVGKALGVPVEVINRLARKIPHFTDISELETARRTLPECRNLPLEEEPYRTIIREGMRIEGFPRHLSVHCGGIVVSPRPITDRIPLQRAAGGLVITQMDMYPVEDLGLVKIDLLGQRALAVVSDTLEAVERHYGERVDFRAVRAEEDPAALELVKKGETIGCFYVESPGMRNLLRRLGVSSFEMLTAASSIIRPGVSDSGMMKAFIERHCGREPVRYLHPLMEEILGETFGVMIYQEDVIKVAHRVAGMSLGEADSLRRCMSKKRNWEAMGKHRERFIQGAVARGVEPAVAGEIWRQVESFGGYAFCKAHSASFAQVSYQTAYLKARYPAEFMAAVLSNQGGFYSTFEYVEEARRWGITILPPDINRGRIAYTAEPAADEGPRGRVPPGRCKAIRVGLMQVKGLTGCTAKAIESAREEGGLFTSLADFCRRVKPDYPEARNLILCGAMDGFDLSRPELLWRLELLHKTGSSSRRSPLPALAQGAPGLFRPPDRPVHAVPVIPDYTPEEKLKLEKDILGLTASCHPLELFRNRLRGQKDIVAACDLARHLGRRVRVVGWMVTAKRTRTSKGEWMKFLTLEDTSASFEVTLWPRVYLEYGHLLDGRGPYLVEGCVEGDGGGLMVVAEAVEVPQ